MLTAMKKLIVFVLLWLSTSASAEWTYAGANEDLVAYADMTTIRKRGNMVKMWRLYDFKNAQGSSDGKSYLSSMSQYEYDCGGERHRILYVSWHSGRLGDGKVVNFSASSNTWNPVTPGSIDQSLWNVACK
jgi:hypothetical protein